MLEQLKKDYMILKLKPTDIYFRPKIGTNSIHSFGYRCIRKIKSGDFEGRINIKCEFDLPEGYEICFEIDNKNINKLFESLEYSKTTDELDRHTHF